MRKEKGGEARGTHILTSGFLQAFCSLVPPLPEIVQMEFVGWYVHFASYSSSWDLSSGPAHACFARYLDVETDEERREAVSAPSISNEASYGQTFPALSRSQVARV